MGDDDEGARGLSSQLPPSRFGAGYTLGAPENAAADSSAPLRYSGPTFRPAPFDPGNASHRQHYPPPTPPVAAPVTGIPYGDPVMMMPVAYPAAPRRTNGMAIASLVCSLFIPCVGWILGLIFGHIALSQIKRTGDEGRGLAVAGLVISYLALAGVVIYVVVVRLLIWGPGL